MRIRSIHRQGGFSLIELPVATAIYSMGLGSVSLNFGASQLIPGLRPTVGLRVTGAQLAFTMCAAGQ